MMAGDKIEACFSELHSTVVGGKGVSQAPLPCEHTVVGTEPAISG